MVVPIQICTYTHTHTHSDLPSSAKKTDTFFFYLCSFFSLAYLPIHTPSQSIVSTAAAIFNVVVFIAVFFVQFFLLLFGLQMDSNAYAYNIYIYFLCIMLSVPFAWKFMVRRTSICSVRWLHQVNIFVAILSIYVCARFSLWKHFFCSVSDCICFFYRILLFTAREGERSKCGKTQQ